MMLETIKKKILKMGCEIWEITENTARGWEFYFIRHRLDQNRLTEVRTFDVTLYRPLEGEMLGAASGQISPTASAEEVQKTLEDLWFQASLVKNPAYGLQDAPVPQPEIPEVNLEQISGDFIRTMKDLPETPGEDINSYEIFVREITRHFLNSRGVEYVCRYPSSMIEVIVKARRGDHEIELYRAFHSGNCDAQKLREEIGKAMVYGRDRLTAEPTPRLGTFDVLFSTDDSTAIYRYFSDRTNAAMIYRKLSDWNVGKNIGCGLSLRAVPQLENSSRNDPVDEEGSLIRDRFLIRDGKVENIWGARQFSQYLQVENSSLVHNFIVSGGTRSEEEIRKGDYLEIVEFSDFQVDSMSGDIAGEIRLGYLHQGGKVTIVSGGSVSGQMAEMIPDMQFSRETAQYDRYVVPRVTLLRGLRITGVR